MDYLKIVTWAGIIGIVIGTNIILFYYFAVSEKECQSDPLVYGAKQLYELSSGANIIGTVTLFGNSSGRLFITFDQYNRSKPTVIK